jgi:hypothetical protein
MIRTINTGIGITVTGGTNSYPYFNMNSNSSTSISVGTIRYNGQNYNFEVFDGYHWATLPNNYTMIELSSDTQNILSWARTKQAEEEYLKNEAEKNPTIKDLLSQRNEIDNKITMVKTLIQNCKVCEQ